MNSYADIYLEDILNYQDDNTQSLYYESDNEDDDQPQTYYPQYQSFLYLKPKMNPNPNLTPNFYNKPLSYIYKYNPEYKEIFNKDFFANHN